MTNAPARLWLLLSIVAMPALADAGDPVPRTDSEAADEEAYAFRFMFTPARTIYYVIENDYSDGAAISAQIPLAYNDSVIERRTYIQETQTPTTRDSGKSAKNLVGPVQWICDRYEVRQQGSFREDAAFDSLRNTYPVAALRGLSKVHGSKIIFMMDPATAKPASVQTRPGSTVAPTTSDRLSSTAQKCLVSGSNAERMLNDMGTLYFPDGPKRVGETWTLTHRTNHKSFGTTITKLDCTLRSVRDVDGSQIATIDLHGQIKMATAPGLSAPPASAAEKGTDQKAEAANVTATTQPTTAPVSKTRGRQVARDKRPPRTTPARLAKKDEKRRLERAVCTGSVEFDLTHGEVVRMNIHREIALVKTLSGGKSDKTPVQANQTQAHTFRVRRYQSRPRYPIIQGGPKPPPEPVKKASPAKPFRRRPTTRVADAKRRAAKARNRRSEKLTEKPTAKRQPSRKNPNRTARKGANKRRTPTSQPRDPRLQQPTSRPAGAKRPRTINRPTSQPAQVPTTRPA